MNDKEFNLLRKRVRKLRSKWHNLLGLRWWTVTYCYEREKSKDKPTYDEGHSDIGAQTSVQYPYKTAQVYFYLPSLEDLDDERLESLVIHEMVHILVNEMRYYDKDTDHEERVVSDLTSAFIWVGESKKYNETTN